MSGAFPNCRGQSVGGHLHFSAVLEAMRYLRATATHFQEGTEFQPLACSSSTPILHPDHVCQGHWPSKYLSRTSGLVFEHEQCDPARRGRSGHFGNRSGSQGACDAQD